ncbi:hypothetical protein D7X00_16155, partial [Shigella boydii]|nr:hypothetical protein [Shigella flexneri]EFX6086128.1 hypothetical protein [Shigella boydii]EFX2208490.1 hypothetical protein [Shigella flexneri]EFX2217102.1 hypothetical protein [Shigella flexneri]EFX2920985.1 hypothetical protein [Shigella flexneri]
NFFFSLEHLCCSEVSISPLFRWPNSVCHFTRAAFKVWQYCFMAYQPERHYRKLSGGREA